MATVHDLAAYILKAKGPLTSWKLQKLVYYSQAWSLVWDEAPLFNARIEAWANGPVVRALYAKHRGKFNISSWPDGNPSVFTETQEETIDAVLSYYGDKSSQWLSDLTHQEQPWREARHGLSPGDRSNRVITRDAMAEYYGSL